MSLYIFDIIYLKLRIKWSIHLSKSPFFNDITIYVCVPHFYDLFALVGCWSSDSIRRIIYELLNVCPFHYTAVAVSGKVERS